MFIGPMIAGAGRIAAGAGRLAGRGARGLKNNAQQRYNQWREGRADRQAEQEQAQQGGPSGREIGAVAAGGAAGGLMGGLASRASSAKEHVSKHGALIFVLLAWALFGFDVAFDYKGFNIISIDSAYEIVNFVLSLAYVIFAWALFYYFVSRERSFKALVWSTIALIVFIFSTAVAVRHQPLAIIHIVYILVFWFFFIRPREEYGPRAYMLLILLLVMDLYLYSFLNIFSEEAAKIVEGIPILFFLTLSFVYQQTQNFWALVSMGLALLFYLIVGGPALGEKLGLAGIFAETPEIPSPGEVWNRLVKKPIARLSEGIGGWVRGRIQYAITGKVEENQYEPLGVYFEDVRTTQPVFYIDRGKGEKNDSFEEVIIFGTVKAKTLDDPIYLKMGCFVEKNNEKRFAEKIDPNKRFPVFALEEKDFACTFTEEQLRKEYLKEGSNTVKASADFNFETLAYLKSYFINRERLMAMIREEIDPFTEFGIPDKEPKAIYTNGPAEIGVKMSSPLTGVSGSYIAFPRLSLSIQNRIGWEGKITSLRELVLLFPEGIELKVLKDDPFKEGVERDCNFDFEQYDNAACKTSCEKLMYNDCTEVCSGYKNQNEKESCNRFCMEKSTECKDQCQFLFLGEGGKEEYVGYALAQNEIKRLQESSDDDEGRFKFFTCRIEPSMDILENTPITTKFFRVKARYNYSLEKPVSVKIREAPKLEDEGIAIGKAIEFASEFNKKVFGEAERNGIDPALALAFAAKESAFTHCCKEAGKNGIGTCEKVDSQSCDLNRLLSSNNNYGIMQLNKGHCAFFKPEIVCDQYARIGDLAGLGCSEDYKQDEFDQKSADWVEECALYEQANCDGKDATDVDCNIKIGLTYLKKLYGDNVGKKKTWVCDTNNVKEFSSWDLALRLYNRWICNGAELNYVGDVNQIRQTILGQRSLEQFEKLSKPSTSIQASIADKSVKEPKDLKFAKNGKESTIALEWTLSEDDGKSENDVIGYLIFKDDMYLRFIQKGENKFIDKTDTTKKYKYKVEVQDKNGNANSIEKDFEDKKATPPTNLKASAEANAIRLSWDLSADDGGGEFDVVRYDVYRKGENTDYIKIKDMGSGGSEIVDDTAGVSGDFKYFYYVEAIDNAGNKGKSEEVGVLK